MFLSKDIFYFVRRRVINKATYNTAIRDFFYSEIEATFIKRYFPIISPQYIRREYNVKFIWLINTFPNIQANMHLQNRLSYGLHVKNSHF